LCGGLKLHTTEKEAIYCYKVDQLRVKHKKL